MTYCNHSNQKKYPFILPELPYGKEEFNPHFTAETFDYHYFLALEVINYILANPIRSFDEDQDNMAIKFVEV